MSETKDEIAAERDSLRADVGRLEAEKADLLRRLSAAGSTGRMEFQGARRRPFLSEGERQELETYGVTNSPFTGERLNADDVRGELAASDTQHGVQIADAAPELARQVVPARDRNAIEGVDYVWPSVAPGVLADDVRHGQ